MSEEIRTVAVAGWYFTHNPEGEGLLLCVPRGIPCEGHTQVVSHHTTNTPSMATVEAVVDEMREQLTKEINAFVTLMQALAPGNWEVKESIGLLFCHQLVKRVAEAAEKKEFG